MSSFGPSGEPKTESKGKVENRTKRHATVCPL